MAKTPQRKRQGAVLIHGADGRLYFISKTELKKHVIPRKNHGTVAKAPKKGLAQALKEIGAMKSDNALVSEVSVSSLRR